MLENIVIFCFGFVFYSYFGYPLLLAIFSRNISSLNVGKIGDSHPFSVIITVYNEKNFIERKLENTLLQKVNNKTLEELAVQIIVASDASNDGTDELVKKFKNRGVKLLQLDQRKGKEHAQKAAISEASGEVLIFSDAKIMLQDGAIENFLKYFQDEKVGAVSSVDRVVADEQSSSGEGFYVKYEMLLRALESRFNSLVGLSGSGFAVLKKLAVNLRVDVPSDFALLLVAVKQGYRGMHAPDVIGSYKAVATEEAEFSRKVRTVLRGITTFFKSLDVLNPFSYGIFSWQIISHKLCRWLVPIFWLFGSIAAVFLIFSENQFFSLFAYAILYFHLFAYLAFRIKVLRKIVLFKIPLFFIVVNLSILKAWYLYLLGERVELWEPSNKK